MARIPGPPLEGEVARSAGGVNNFIPDASPNIPDQIRRSKRAREYHPFVGRIREPALAFVQ
jgi:hypothetical protein